MFVMLQKYSIRMDTGTTERIPSRKMLLKVVWFPHIKMLLNEGSDAMVEEMTIDERRKYVKLMATRYQQGTRKQRSQLLTEMEQVTSLHRKHLIRLLNGESLDRKRRQTPRKRTYGLEVERVVLRVWESLD